MTVIISLCYLRERSDREREQKMMRAELISIAFTMSSSSSSREEKAETKCVFEIVWG